MRSKNNDVAPPPAASSAEIVAVTEIFGPDQTTVIGRLGHLETGKASTVPIACFVKEIEPGNFVLAPLPACFVADPQLLSQFIQDLLMATGSRLQVPKTTSNARP